MSNVASPSQGSQSVEGYAGSGRSSDADRRVLKVILAELRHLRTDVARVLQALPRGAQEVRLPAGAIRPRIPPAADPVPAPAAREQDGRLVLVVQCLGGFRVWAEGRPLDLGTSRFGRSILRYLVAHGGGPVAREVLMELLWPGVPEDQARHRLNMAVYALRRGLRRVNAPPGGFILYQNGAYLLNPSVDLDVDCDRFLATFRRAEAELAAGNPESAIAIYEQADQLYTGEYLPQERYAAWARITHQMLEDAHHTVLAKLSRLYLQPGQTLRAIETAQRVLAVDACHEQVHRILMRCYARSGQRAQALRQYDECVRLLKAELGVDPSEQTIRLAEQIRAARPV